MQLVSTRDGEVESSKSAGFCQCYYRCFLVIELAVLRAPVQQGVQSHSTARGTVAQYSKGYSRTVQQGVQSHSTAKKCHSKEMPRASVSNRR